MEMMILGAFIFGLGFFIGHNFARENDEREFNAKTEALTLQYREWEQDYEQLREERGKRNLAKLDAESKK